MDLTNKFKALLNTDGMSEFPRESKLDYAATYNVDEPLVPIPSVPSGDYVETAKNIYANRSYEGKRVEPVMFLDGAVTEQNTLLIRLALHEIIRLKALTEEKTDPKFSEYVGTAVATERRQEPQEAPAQQDVFIPENPGFLIPPYIILSIRSPGGDMIAAMALCAMIKSVQSLGIPVVGVVNGIAYSAGFMILTACQFRYMLPHSHLMSHEFKTGIDGFSSQLTNKIKMLTDYNQLTMESILEIEDDLVKSKGFKEFQQEKKTPLEEDGELLEKYIKEKIERPSIDEFMRFDEAKKLGIIHGVISNAIYAKYLFHAFLEDRHIILRKENIKQSMTMEFKVNAKSKTRKVLFEKILANIPDVWPDVPERKDFNPKAVFPVRPVGMTYPNSRDQDEDDWGEA